MKSVCGDLSPGFMKLRNCEKNQTATAFTDSVSESFL